MESVVVVALARLGARDPATAATTVAACFEGLLLHRIARHDETDPRPVFELVLRAALPESASVLRALVEEVADEWFEEKIAEGELLRSFDEDGNEVLKFNEEHPKYKRRQRED